MFSFYDKLTDREKLIVASAIGLLVFMFFYLILNKMFNLRKNLTEQLNETNSQFTQMDRVIKDYNYYRNLKSSNSDDDISQLYSKLDVVLLRHNLKDKVATMKDSSTIIRKEYNKQTIDISFRSVSLNDIIKMTYDIEKNKEISGKVDYLSFRKPFQEKEVYDINLKFSSYNRIRNSNNKRSNSNE
jgi:general secretion pathway protein M